MWTERRIAYGETTRQIEDAVNARRAMTAQDKRLGGPEK